MSSKYSIQLEQIAKHSTNVCRDLLILLDEIFIRLARVHSPGLAVNPFAIEILTEMRDWKERKRIRDAIKQLEKKKLIKTQKQGKKCIIKLTNQGQAEILRQRIIDTKNILPSGDVCMVVFDIPESVKKVRDIFRYFIKRANFRKLQRSVWISKYDVLEDMSSLIKTMKAEKWISIYFSQKF